MVNHASLSKEREQHLWVLTGFQASLEVAKAAKAMEKMAVGQKKGT